MSSSLLAPELRTQERRTGSAVVSHQVAQQRLSLYEALVLLNGKVPQGDDVAHFPTHSPAGLEFALNNHHRSGPGMGPMIYMRLCEDVEGALRKLFGQAYELSPEAKNYPVFLLKK